LEQTACKGGKLSKWLWLDLVLFLEVMTSQETHVNKNKILLLGFFIVVFLAGLGVIISNESIQFSEFLGSLKELNPRIMSLIALPFLAALFVLGAYLRKKNEERKWRQALLKTRAKKQN